jgi:metal-responsive CopG/Arc/MetJ family transcriptional regulator
VKTAISMPDATFAQVERRAAELGVSRSEFLTTAARRYLAELDDDALTGMINDALDLADDDSNAAAAGAGRRALTDDGDDW